MMHLNPVEMPDGLILYNGRTRVYVNGEDYGLTRDAYKLMEKFSGQDVIIQDGTVVIMPVRIGNFVRIGPNCTIKKDVPDNTTIEPGTVWQ